MAGRNNNAYSYTSKDSIAIPSEVFDRPVQFQALILQSDGMGGSTHTWQTVLSTWAHIEALGGRFGGKELWMDGEIWPYVLSRVLIRYRPSFNIDASMRMLQGSKSYNIRSVWVPAEARKVIELIVEEQQAQGSLHNAPQTGQTG